MPARRPNVIMQFEEQPPIEKSRLAFETIVVPDRGVHGVVPTARWHHLSPEHKGLCLGWEIAGICQASDDRCRIREDLIEGW